jgi:peptide chain release factor 1
VLVAGPKTRPSPQFQMIIEIHAAEGGADAKDLVREQLGIYMRRAVRHGVELEVLDEREGSVSLRATGVKAVAFFSEEAGGHRFQRVPPNERRGRVHTSTVTVAVLPEADIRQDVPDSDLTWKATVGSGAGGQARNKTSNAVQLWHVPSGIMVRCESERSQKQNLESAKVLLRAKLWASAVERRDAVLGRARKTQMGTGMRGDKRRTIRMQDGDVHDHVTGRHWRLKEYMRGEW